MLYPMAAKKFRTGPRPGSSVPTRVMTREPEQTIHHSKALHARNPMVGHSSKLIGYEPSPFEFSLTNVIPLSVIKIFKKINFWLFDQKSSVKGLLPSGLVVYNASSTHTLGIHFSAVKIKFWGTNPLNLKHLQLDNFSLGS